MRILNDEAIEVKFITDHLCGRCLKMKHDGLVETVYIGGRGDREAFTCNECREIQRVKSERAALELMERVPA